jgi:hypothetical protein
MWRRVDLAWTDVSEECIASIFRVENSAVTCSRWFLARGFFYLEDSGDTFLWNVGSQDLHGAISQKTAFFNEHFLQNLFHFINRSHNQLFDPYSVDTDVAKKQSNCLNQSIPTNGYQQLLEPKSVCTKSYQQSLEPKSICTESYQ